MFLNCTSTMPGPKIQSLLCIIPSFFVMFIEAYNMHDDVPSPNVPETQSIPLRIEVCTFRDANHR